MSSDMPERGDSRWKPSFGVWPQAGGAGARVWAPQARRVELQIEGPGNQEARDVHREPTVTDNEPVDDSRHPSAGSRLPRRIPLAAERDGFFGACIAGLTPGTRYRFVLDAGQVIPDPASRFQPEGVHGPSAFVDPRDFAWRHPCPRDARLADAVVYELHVGTFTSAGTFTAAAERLAWLADLGVTAVELMPVAAFPGCRNWGYDGAALFAPAAVYGSPDDLRRLVDHAHGLGLRVLLDVVYNHFGPDGAYAVAASPRFLSERHRSAWGQGINLDGSDAGPVRAFFIDNALHWLMEYRLDGLRLDATHALVDESRVHFLAELAGAVRRTLADRQVWLIAEDHRNLRTLLDPADAGGWGLDAVWADDFHHVARRLTAGDDEGYFRDYAGSTEELAGAMRRGWLFTGEYSVHHGAARGTSSEGLELSRFVISLQNHDQVGNRARGDRLHHVIDTATWRAVSVLLLLAPETPLLFMGQEWAASSPFLYFTDHEPGLGRLVREGRRAEFQHFRAFRDPDARAGIPDPQDVETYERSRLRWDEITRPPHAGTLALYRHALALRRLLAPPEGPSGSLGPDEIDAAGPDGLWMRRRLRDGGDLLVVCRLRGAGPVLIPEQDRSPTHDAWKVRLDTEDPAFAQDSQRARVAEMTSGVEVTFVRPGAVVLERRGA
jgi:maltooligosyltrehalose trehalohydrolase